MISMPLLVLAVSRLACSKIMMSLGHPSFSKYDVGMTGFIFYKENSSSSDELPTSSEVELLDSSCSESDATSFSPSSSFCFFLECFYLVSIIFNFNYFS